MEGKFIIFAGQGQDNSSDPAYTLTDLAFHGYSSPDGGYAKNKSLSDARTQTVFNEVWSVIPAGWKARIFKEAKGHVAPWTDVADILEKQSMASEAEEIRGIVSSYPDDMDRQGAQIKRLPYYASKVVPVLPELRSVKCEHKSVVFRFLSKEEILAKYENDPDFRSGKKPFTLNEYWELFNLVKDEKELEELYNRARIAAIRAEGKKNPWALPANTFASARLTTSKILTEDYGYGLSGGASFGKWLHQDHAVRLGASAGQWQENHKGQSVLSLSLDASYLFNLSSYVGGYRTNRFCEVMIVAGAGYSMAYLDKISHALDAIMNLNFGIEYLL